MKIAAVACFVIALFASCARPELRTPSSVNSDRADLYISKAKRVEKLCKPCQDGKRFSVHLTFDDGPSVFTERFAETLRKKGVRATFFQIGANYSSDPASKRFTNFTRASLEDVKRIAAGLKSDGHNIASHTFAHFDHVTELFRGKYDAAALQTNLKKSFDGFPSSALHYVRLPYGQGWWKYPDGSEEAGRQQAIMKQLEAAGWKHLGWDIDTFDWSAEMRENQPRFLLDEICEQKGGVVLMHDIQPWTAANLETLIDSIECSGHKIVPLQEMEKQNARTPMVSFQRENTPVPVKCELGLGEIKTGKCLVKPERQK